jgi:hypothetical protein
MCAEHEVEPQLMKLQLAVQKRRDFLTHLSEPSSDESPVLISALDCIIHDKLYLHGRSDPLLKYVREHVDLFLVAHPSLRVRTIQTSEQSNEQCIADNVEHILLMLDANFVRELYVLRDELTDDY